MALSEAQEHILQYWKQVRQKTGGLPAREDFTLRGLGRYASNIAVLAVQSDPVDFEYRLIGTSVEQHLQQDYTGKKLSEIPDKGPNSAIWGTMLDTLKGGEPIVVDLPDITPDTKKHTIHTLYLPLATDRKQPDKILMVPNFNNGRRKQPGIKIKIG